MDHLNRFRDHLIELTEERTFAWFQECQPKILLVTDQLNYNIASDFGLSIFAETLATMSLHGMRPQVIRASRGGAAGGATLPNFRFDDASHGVLKTRYDVVFLFGVGREGFNQIDSGELAALGRFMQAGGGVFATGDHESLGASMGRDIPRVRAMRFWKQSETPTVADKKRLSTNLSGSDETEEFVDQSDRFPQRLYLNFRTTAGGVGQPHPLLQMPAPGRAIEIFPDHPHEGECCLPTDFSSRFELDGRQVGEWPGKVRPEAVAMSMSHGDGFTNKDALEPRSFLSICAYDGQAAGVGRVVTDATWHHFVNINLDGSGSGLPGETRGLAPNDLERIRQYYRNLATWLMPATTRRCLRPLLLINELRRFPLFEELDLPRPPEWREAGLRQLGGSVAEGLRRRLTRWEVEALLEDALMDSFGEKAAQLAAPSERVGRLTRQDLAQAALGGLVGGLITALEDTTGLEELQPHGNLEKAMLEGSRRAAALALKQRREELQAVDCLLAQVG